MSKALLLGGSVRQVVFGLGAALLFILAIEFAQMGFGGFGFFGWDGFSFGWHGASVTERNGQLSVTVRDQGCYLKAQGRGEIQVNDTEDQITGVSEGGFFALKETGCGPDLEIEAQPGAAVTVKLDGQLAPDDPKTRERVHQSLLRMWQLAGWQAETRAQRLLQKGGVEKVLAEAEVVRSDTSQSVYLLAVFGTPSLSEPQIDRAWAVANSITSDYELSQLVQKAPPTALHVRPALLDTLSSLSSDYEMREALQYVVQSHPLENAEWAGLFRVALQLSSDYETREFLRMVADHLPSGQTPPTELDEVLASISSDYEQRQALEAFFVKPMDRELLTRLLRIATESISSDYELRQLLETMAANQQAHQPWPQEVDRAIDAIASRDDRDAARTALSR